MTHLRHGRTFAPQSIVRSFVKRGIVQSCTRPPRGGSHGSPPEPDCMRLFTSRETVNRGPSLPEDIITALSRFRQLFVIARNSSFVYKGRAVDVKQVSRDLGVRYVLEGSVRKAANRIRITASLSMPQRARIYGQSVSTVDFRTSSICKIRLQRASWAK